MSPEIEWEDSPEAQEMREQMERDHLDDERRELEPSEPLAASSSPAWEPTWQDIASAPDDMPVLVFWRDGPLPVCATAIHSYAPGLQGWWAWGSRQVYPTMWMPLPPAPKEPT